VAYPATETGSIGVVFGKPNLHGLYDKVGITKDFVSRGRFALIDSDYQSLSDAGKAKLREGIDASYTDFVAKVAAGRHKPVSAIEPIAQGRVWLGDQAKANGLVDELGGLDRALEIARQKAGIAANAKINLVLYPAKRSIFDLLFSKGGGDSDAEAHVEALLSRAGLEPLKAAWRDDRLRVFMHGGMLRMMPFSIEVH
jgi:protease-4